MKNHLAALSLAALLAGCAMGEKQIKALGPGDKAACFHARCDSMLCGGPWSTTTTGAAATDGKVPAISERCAVGQPEPKL